MTVRHAGATVPSLIAWALVGAIGMGVALGDPLAVVPGAGAGALLRALHARRTAERARRRRSARILRALPDALELLAAVVDGGAPPDQAVARVAGCADEPLAGELRAAVAEGAGVGGRLRVADRELRPLGSLLAQSEELGIPVAAALRLLAADARLRARAAAREQAAAAAPRMLLVVGGLLAPASLVLVLGGQALAMRSLIGPVLG